MRDEISCAFDETLALDGAGEIVHLICFPFLSFLLEWQLVHASPMVLTVIARTVNRLFVGLPTCMSTVTLELIFRLLTLVYDLGRNKEYLKLAVQFAIDVVIGGQLINMLPGFLRP